ncbi:Uncharacterised protein [Mycobacteroides abscessus subsp. abscessus]|nr:Uncharacterised protein [Mycobacteroides abscessus subsp. abscessus]
MDFLTDRAAVDFHFIIRHIGMFIDVISRSKANISIHLAHHVCFKVSHHIELLILRAEQERPVDLLVLQQHEREAARCIGFSDKCSNQFALKSKVFN